MNALPQKAHNYEGLQLPKIVTQPRERSRQKIEYIDERRAAKLAAKKRQDAQKRQQFELMRKKQQEMIELKKIDSLYNPVRAQEAPKQQAVSKQRKAQRRNKSKNKKTTAAYEVPIKKARNAEKHGDKHFRVNADGSLAVNQQRRAAIPGFDMYVEEGPAAEAFGKQVAEEYPVPKSRGVFSTILTIILVFVMLAGVLNMHASQSKIVYQNEQTKKAIVSLEKDIEKYEMEIASKEDLNSIQTRALELNMGHPTDNQLVYLPEEKETVQVETGYVTDDAGNLLGNEIDVVTDGSILQDKTMQAKRNDLQGWITNTFSDLKDWLNEIEG